MSIHGKNLQNMVRYSNESYENFKEFLRSGSITKSTIYNGTQLHKK